MQCCPAHDCSILHPRRPSFQSEDADASCVLLRTDVLQGSSEFFHAPLHGFCVAFVVSSSLRQPRHHFPSSIYCKDEALPLDPSCVLPCGSPSVSPLLHLCLILRFFHTMRHLVPYLCAKKCSRSMHLFSGAPDGGFWSMLQHATAGLTVHTVCVIAACPRGRGRNNSLMSHLRFEFLTRTRSSCSARAVDHHEG